MSDETIKSILFKTSNLSDIGIGILFHQVANKPLGFIK